MAETKRTRRCPKGSAPAHSLSIDENTNRINMTGFSYDANGNMTAMPNAGAPATAMAYDIANRMVESVHNTAGTYRFGYNHANQRVFQYTNTTAFGSRNRRFSLYGFAGELLLEANRTESGVQPHTGEVVRYVYFLGRKMFASVNRGPLKAAVPNRLGSRSDHFPYGELKGAPPPDGDKDNFTTYRRDANGLDYAWNRYYAPSVGRFTTADPYGGSAVAALPESWNRYTYVGGNPVNRTDPTGLFWGFMPGGSGSDWVECAMNPFGAMSANWLTCGQSPWSQEMWSIIGPWGPISPEPIVTPLMQRTAEDRREKENEILRDLARVARTRGGRGVGVMPMSLKITDPTGDDYYECGMGKAVVRNVVYQLFGTDNQKLYGVTITEHLWNTEDDSPVVPSRFSGTTKRVDGLFWDQISVQFGFPKKYLQCFTVTGVSASGLPLVNFPVFVVGWGKQYGFLYVEKTRTEVTINGDKGRLIQCN